MQFYRMNQRGHHSSFMKMLAVSAMFPLVSMSLRPSTYGKPTFMKNIREIGKSLFVVIISRHELVFAL